ncbi:hypothetical protein [Anseongella ginsenosidimutans]|uniref:hypothetical protein n=1 Tax=Anseongella ginsenosidimutans TaxID=496056 RepID=UPI0013159333|nr:hypothetical protein [Anseongella ginsenosidimutans]
MPRKLTVAEATVKKQVNNALKVLRAKLDVAIPVHCYPAIYASFINLTGKWNQAKKSYRHG